MQPNGTDIGNDVRTPPLIAVARDAFLHDDLEACIRALDSANSLSRAEKSEATLLRARVLLRRYRFRDTVALLANELRSFTIVDEAATARMLHGIAVARSGEIGRGLTLLTDLDEAAKTLEPHPTIRAEISYWLAFAYWLKRDHRPTLDHAIAAEQANADVISVRAACLRGYVAAARERYHDALKLFRWSLDAYGRCRERDDDLLGRIVLQVSMLELALRSANVGGTHTLPAQFGRIPESSLAGTGTFRFRIATYDAWLYALDGDKREAYDLGRVAESLAPNDAWRVWVRANRALLSVAFGDAEIAYVCARDAEQLVQTVDWDSTADEQRIGLLLLTEALARTDPPHASAIFERYEKITSDIDRSLLFNDDVRLWIVETWVRGLLSGIAGEADQAWRAFKAVHNAARPLGLLWQTAQALIELDSIPLAARPRGDNYLQAAALLVRANFPRSFIARRLGRWMTVYRDPVAAKLAPRLREVLRHFLAAKPSKEVAATLGISEHTMKDYTEMLFRAFGARRSSGRTA